MKLSLTIFCLFSNVAALSAQTSRVTQTPAVQKSELSVQHLSIPSAMDFDATTKRFEAQLGTFDPDAIKTVATASPDELRQIRAKVEAMAGSSGLMRFGLVRAHGLLLPLVGQPPAKAVQYAIGNPLVAVEMTRYNLVAGLYAPLRAIIWEDKQGTTRIDYDLPSSLFGQFRDAHIDAVAAKLDWKMAALVKSATAP
jgi:hypothetical protein